MLAADKLKKVILERGYSQAEIARKLGITPKTFYKKMKKGVFLSNEIEAIIEILELENPFDIFFASQVSQKATMAGNNYLSLIY